MSLFSETELIMINNDGGLISYKPSKTSCPSSASCLALCAKDSPLSIANMAAGLLETAYMRSVDGRLHGLFVCSNFETGRCASVTRTVAECAHPPKPFFR